MKNQFENLLKTRRSIYSIGNKLPVSETEIEELVKAAVLHSPSAFNAQSTRVVLLFNNEHLKLWDIAKNVLKTIVPENAFEKTELKINTFASGAGTVLFFEDENVTKSLQEQFPLYKDSFPTYSEHASAMAQFAVWNLLASVNVGATLQHYNPLIDEQVKQTWNLPSNFKLIAQMPFGNILKPAETKEFEPLENRFFVFK